MFDLDPGDGVPCRWTERVSERLVAVFHDLPNTAVYSTRKGVSEPSRPIDGLISAGQLCRGRENRTVNVTPKLYRRLNTGRTHS